MVEAVSFPFKLMYIALQTFYLKHNIGLKRKEALAKGETVDIPMDEFDALKVS